LARQGANVVALDYTDAAHRHIRRRARRSGLPVTFQRMNLYDTRSVLTTGARLAHRLTDQSVDLYARLLLNALNDFGRYNFWLFARMLVPLGGRIYLEFRTPRDRTTRHEFPHWRRYLEPDRVIEDAQQIGAVVADRREGRGLAPFGGEDPYVCQLVLKGR
jgi:NAD(P)-dependent dehydrogenase (short-subunit alcohol dehydrogenase family)